MLAWTVRVSMLWTLKRVHFRFVYWSCQMHNIKFKRHQKLRAQYHIKRSLYIWNFPRFQTFVCVFTVRLGLFSCVVSACTSSCEFKFYLLVFRRSHPPPQTRFHTPIHILQLQPHPPRHHRDNQQLPSPLPSLSVSEIACIPLPCFLPEQPWCWEV